MKKQLAALLVFLLMMTLVPTALAETDDGADTSADTADRITVACVGDSLTQGTCCSDEAIYSYPAVLRDLLDGNTYEVGNYGASGFAAMKKYNSGWSYWGHANFSKSHDCQPDVVILMLGTNDIIHERFDTDYRTDMKALIESYKTLDSQPTVYLVTAPVAYDSRSDNLQNKLLPAQKQIAQETGCPLIDLNTETAAWDRNTLYAPDGLHFNDAGYRKIAEYFYQTIFEGELRTLTVRARDGITVSLAGQTGSEIVTGDGKKTLRVSNGTTSLTFDIEVKGDTVLDLGDATLEPGTSFSPSVTYVQKETSSQETSSVPDRDGDEDGDGKGKLWIVLLIVGDLLAVAVVVAVVIALKKKKG